MGVGGGQDVEGDWEAMGGQGHAQHQGPQPKHRTWEANPGGEPAPRPGMGFGQTPSTRWLCPGKTRIRQGV